VKQGLLQRWPGDIHEMYGLTEGGLTTALDLRHHLDKLASVGKPSKTAVVKIIDEEGREVPPGVVGEVIGRSNAMMRGYHGRPDLTEAMLHRHTDGQAYFLTGDLGRFDEDGFLYIVGRKKDVIISGGFNIYAVDLEDVMLAHPDVLEAAVIGVPSAEWGETPVGIAVLKPGAQTAAADMRAYVNERVGRNQRLKDIYLASEIPRNALGKPMKEALRARYAS
jgi:long-chain acyl-CoA synthetase